MRLAIITSTSPLQTLWPRLADEQVLIGAQQIDQELDGHVYSRRAPLGEFPLGPLLAALPADQRPEVIACHVDGHTNSWPTGVSACGATTVLLVADAESTPGGLSRILDYARRERFDRIVLCNSGVDEPVFRSIPGAEVFWFPGLLCAVRDRSLPIVRQPQRDPAVWVAPTPFRGSLAHRLTLERVHARAVHLHTWSEELELRLEELGDGAVALISSEHGEWSPALFEALAAGTTVIATGLPPADLERLWPQGAPLLTADTVDEVAQLTRRLLAELPDDCPTGRFGAAWYDQFLNEAQRRTQFARIVHERVGPIAPTDRSLPAPTIESLLRYGPAIHLASEIAWHPTVLGPATDERIAALLTRYPRLRASTTCAEPQLAFASSAGAPAPLVLLETQEAAPPGYSAGPGTDSFALRTEFAQRWRARQELGQAWEQGDTSRLSALAKEFIAQAPGDMDGVLGVMSVFIEAGAGPAVEKCIGLANRFGPHDPRFHALLADLRISTKRLTVNRVDHAWSLYAERRFAEAQTFLPGFVEAKYTSHRLRVLKALLAEATGDRTAAADAWATVARHHPNDDRLWFICGLALARAGQLAAAGHALWRAADRDRTEPDFDRAYTSIARLEPSAPPRLDLKRNLVVASSENCQKHGAGVLVKRFFGRHRDTISLRPATYYDGVEEAGAVHFYVPYRELPPRRLQTRLRHLFLPYALQHIMCVPFRREECLYALAAQEVSGARLCTYVMDDRNVLIPENDDAILGELFARSSLRLAISSELQMAYTIKYDHDFELMPPIVVDRSARRQNRWTPKVRPATHVALVGSIWTDLQLKQLLRFVVRARLTVDWFGRQASTDLSNAGVNAMGFVSEQELADRLVDYPLVLVPSGMLDGTEQNEWLTRLSLPSRICFLLQTQTPCLVLGSKDTCASRHIMHLGIGRVIPYNDPDPQKAIAEMTDPAARAKMLRAAAAAADGFVMPEAGRWIWDSTDQGAALPAPFHEFMDRVPELAVVWPPAVAGPIRISHLA